MNRYDERRPRPWQQGRDRDERYRDDDSRFQSDEYSGRMSGDEDRQREWRGRDWGRPSGGDDRWSQPYGQREPYNSRSENSRYSESQYGMGRRRAAFDPYGERSEPRFGEGPFADTSESPSYFGSGNYGDGGASFTGGYDQRWRSRNPGSLGEDTFTREHTPRQEQRRYRTGPKGYTRSDDRIREDICERLMLADSIDSSEVTVSVKDGKVTLEGTVPTRNMKHQIEDVADYAAGVQDVDNRIRVERAACRHRRACRPRRASRRRRGAAAGRRSSRQ